MIFLRLQEAEYFFKSFMSAPSFWLPFLMKSSLNRTFLWKLRSIHLSAYYVWRALVYFKRALFISI